MALGICVVVDLAMQTILCFCDSVAYSYPSSLVFISYNQVNPEELDCGRLDLAQKICTGAVLCRAVLAVAGVPSPSQSGQLVCTSP